jgi:hypothetical protein
VCDMTARAGQSEFEVCSLWEPGRGASSGLWRSSFFAEGGTPVHGPSNHPNATPTDPVIGTNRGRLYACQHWCSNEESLNLQNLTAHAALPGWKRQSARNNSSRIRRIARFSAVFSRLPSLRQNGFEHGYPQNR